MLFATGRRRLFAVLLVAAIPWTVVASDPATTRSAGCDENSAVPANLLIRDQFMQALAPEMIRRSPTFRTQLLTIGGTQLLLIHLRNDHRSIIGLTFAQTIFGRSAAGYLVANIDIPSTRLQPQQTIEYIAHELEHVLEQIEGLDLPSLARIPRSGVHLVDANNTPSFETDRARLAGMTVQREYFFAAGQCEGGVLNTIPQFPVPNP